MDYLGIILNGYYGENTREHLGSYFSRECKKAERENYTAIEFFNGCSNVTESMMKHLQEPLHERKKELYLMLNGAKQRTLKYGSDSTKPIEQRRKETISSCEQELSNISETNFTVHLHSFTKGRWGGSMTYKEVLIIQTAIAQAHSLCITKSQKKPQKKKRHETLLDIWLGTTEKYDMIIAKLKEDCLDIDKPFLIEQKGKLCWYNKHGARQYLKGFILTCINKNWIADEHSASTYQRILYNTFNISFNAKPFQQIVATPPLEKYLLPFKTWPSNI